MQTVVKDIKIKKKFEIVIFLIFIFLCLMIAGINFNIIVIKNNGGRMPFYSEWENYSSVTHFSFNSFDKNIKYYYLSDIFFIKIADNPGYHYSAGDFFIYIGLYGFFINLIIFSCLLLKYRKKIIIIKTHK